MVVFAAIEPGWVHALALLVLAALLSMTAASMIKDVSLSQERVIAALAAVLLATACIGIAVYTFLR